MKNKNYIYLLVILLLAIIIRFWGLGTVPLSPDWDEVSLGYNAYSILHTGHDEFGKFLPVVLESFGDYKPALYSYLTIPSIALFGLNVFAVRFPSAMFGVLTVLATYFLIDELFKNKRLALVVSFLLSISPWDVQFSRIGFEANVGLAFNVFAALFFIKGLKKPWYLVISVVFMALNLYVYQSEKVFTPLFALALVLIYRKELFALAKKYLIIPLLIGLAVSLPMIVYIATNSQSLARAEGVSVFSEQTQLLQTAQKDLNIDERNHNYIGILFYNRRVVYTKEVIANYLSHYDLNWLFITGGDITRHHAPGMGLLYLWELPFLGIGIYYFLFHKYPPKTKWLVFSWFLLAPVPAAVTTDVPHAVRTLNFLPTFQVFTALGLLNTYQFVEAKSVLKRYGNIQILLYGLVIIIALFNFIYYLDQYFVQTNYFTAEDWQYGYKQIVDYVSPIHNNYRQVIVDDNGDFSQSYIFFLFYMKYDPSEYLKAGGSNTPGSTQKFSNYVFRRFNFADAVPYDLYIGTPSDFPNTVKPQYVVHYPNGNIAMEVVGGPSPKF